MPSQSFSRKMWGENSSEKDMNKDFGDTRKFCMQSFQNHFIMHLQYSLRECFLRHHFIVVEKITDEHEYGPESIKIDKHFYELCGLGKF